MPARVTEQVYEALARSTGGVERQRGVKHKKTGLAYAQSKGGKEYAKEHGGEGDFAGLRIMTTGEATKGNLLGW